MKGNKKGKSKGQLTNYELSETTASKSFIFTRIPNKSRLNQLRGNCIPKFE